MLKLKQLDQKFIDQALRGIHSIDQIVIEGGSIKRIEMKTDFGLTHLVANEYGTSMKLLVEEKKKYFILKEFDHPSDKDLQIMLNYVLDRNLKFYSKKGAEEHIKDLSVKEYITIVEVDPNDIEPDNKSVSSLDEIPF